MRICDRCSTPNVQVSFNRVKVSLDSSLAEDGQVANFPHGVDLCHHCWDALVKQIDALVTSYVKRGGQ